MSPARDVSSLPTRRSALGLFGLGLLGGGAWALAARPATAAAAAPQDAQTITAIQNYLNGIHTLISRFDQVANFNAPSSGTIYLLRPGHMRIQYDPPSPILIVADGAQIYYYDASLQQVSRTKTSDTPAWFLLRDDIRLNGDVTVTNFARSQDQIYLSMVATAHADLGHVTLTLNANPLALTAWEVIDAQQKTVKVALRNPQFGAPINKNLFYWTDPRSITEQSR